VGVAGSNPVVRSEKWCGDQSICRSPLQRPSGSVGDSNGTPTRPHRVASSSRMKASLRRIRSNLTGDSFGLDDLRSGCRDRVTGAEPCGRSVRGTPLLPTQNLACLLSRPIPVVLIWPASMPPGYRVLGPYGLVFRQIQQSLGPDVLGCQDRQPSDDQEDPGPGVTIMTMPVRSRTNPAAVTAIRLPLLAMNRRTTPNGNHAQCATRLSE
jgi:hypothetical protein